MPRLRTLLASLAVLVGGTAALGAATDGFRAFTTESARRIAVRDRPVDIPAVALQSQSGGRIAFSDFRGKWLLVDFIYTRCPTVCLALGGDFAQLERLLARPIAQGRVRLLSVSFDPAHDTPERLARYLQRFGGQESGWIAARPITTAGLAEVKRAFGLTVIPDEYGGYTHNTAIHLVDPRGRLVEILDTGDAPRVALEMRRRLSP
ncbi:MAG: SCO family protein [Proteobacteria bacterium]|nr:SCO family protein [Pseudomonadota bacterium]